MISSAGVSNSKGGRRDVAEEEASWANVVTGVIGDTGGRSGEEEREDCCELPDIGLAAEADGYC